MCAGVEDGDRALVVPGEDAPDAGSVEAIPATITPKAIVHTRSFQMWLVDVFISEALRKNVHVCNVYRTDIRRSLNLFDGSS